jgi:hypothetical protein
MTSHLAYISCIHRRKQPIVDIEWSNIITVEQDSALIALESQQSWSRLTEQEKASIETGVTTPDNILNMI